VLCGSSGDFSGSEVVREVIKVKGIIIVAKVPASVGQTVDLHYIITPDPFLTFF